MTNITFTENITIDMVKKGYQHGYIKIVNVDGEIMCRIGDYAFYFCGSELENLSLDEFLAVTNEEDNLWSIYNTLETFKTDSDFQDEYRYYYWFLKENQ